MRIGIMGVHYGHIGGMIQSALQATNGHIVGLVEDDDALCERYSSIPRFATLEDMIDRAQPELILEGLIHHEKTALEACARAGIHLLLDKPLCHSLDDWEHMRRAVASSSIHVSMWFTSRSYPPFIALRQAILDGALGDHRQPHLHPPAQDSPRHGPSLVFRPKSVHGRIPRPRLPRRRSNPLAHQCRMRRRPRPHYLQTIHG